MLHGGPVRAAGAGIPGSYLGLRSESRLIVNFDVLLSKSMA